MGGSKPSAPVTYIPTPAAPTLYKSVIPEADFKRAADYLARIKADTKEAEQRRYLRSGTPEEIGDRQAEIRAREAATYAASLPQGSEYDFARAVASKKPAEITDVYRNILGREPDVPGLAHYAGSRMNIKNIESDIFQSPENKKKQINTLYQEVFGRDVDPSGLETYTKKDPRAQGGLTQEKLASIKQDLFRSAEYKAKHPDSVEADSSASAVTTPAAATPPPATTTPPPAAAAKPSESDETPSWAIGTPNEMAAQAHRDKEAELDRAAQAEEARVNRMIQAKELAEKAKKAGVDGTTTPDESKPELADSAARYA